MPGGTKFQMFDCPNEKCGKKAERLVASSAGLGCDSCQPKVNRGLDAIIGRVRIPANKWGHGTPRVTEADAQRIKTNRKGPDGQYRPAPRWRTTGD